MMTSHADVGGSDYGDVSTMPLESHWLSPYTRS